MAEESPREVVVAQEQDEPGDRPAEAILRPGKLLRIATMTRELLEEVRQTTLDEAGRTRLQRIYESSVQELNEVLSEDLREELRELAVPIEGSASASEIRIAQAQLLGWLEGLFHGIQAALWAQQVQARSTLDEMRRRGLPQGPSQPPQPTGRPEGGGPPGQYL